MIVWLAMRAAEAAPGSCPSTLRTRVEIGPSSFGTVGSGWTFTIALTGQDGFNHDQARSFAATPQDFQFGVCSVGESSPICSVNPGSVPKVMDTIPPSDITQDSELDPTLPPVMLHGVGVP